jgi:histidyl-tRNA synthetase
LGGGRYDGLSEALGGPRAPGIGFAIGEDRFVMALAASSGVDVPESVPQAYVAPLGEGMNALSAKLASELRSAGIRVELGDESFRLKKSFETAEKLGIQDVIIVGEDEAKSGHYSVKNVKTGDQQKVSRRDLVQKLHRS